MTCPGWAERLRADDPAETERSMLIALDVAVVAVVAEWNTLGSDVRRELFCHSAGEAPETAQLREQISRFLHEHKDDGTIARAGAGQRRWKRAAGSTSCAIGLAELRHF